MLIVWLVYGRRYKDLVVEVFAECILLKNLKDIVIASSRLWVVDDEGKLVSVITVGDCLRRFYDNSELMK